MLTKVVLTNFQAHKYLEVDCAGFTTLTGGSNGGKSAVLRAIQGLVRNDSAADYVRHGQKMLSVKLYFDDGYVVEWIKGSGENKYILTDPDSHSRTFDKVGADVPEEVRSVLRLGPIAVKGSDKEYVNFHNQLESPFLISSTPGSVAKLFGELTSASDLYSAVSEGNRQVRSTGALRSTRKTDVEKIKDGLLSYDNLDNQVVALEEAKKAFNKCQETELTLTKLTETINSLRSIIKAEATLTKLTKSLQAAEGINLDALYEEAQTYVGIQSAITKSKKFDEYELAAVGLVSALEKTSEVNLTEVEMLSIQLNNFQHTVNAIKTYDSQIMSLETNIDQALSTIRQLDQQIIDSTGLLDVCSECGQELTEHAKAMLIEGASEHAAC